MNDLAKCLVAVALCAGAYGYSTFQRSQDRNLDSVAGQKLTMVQGEQPQPGRPVILEFWGTYCGPCVASIPHLNGLHSRFGSRVQFVAITAEPVDVVKAFMSTHRMAYPVAVDSSSEFFQAWKVQGIPTLVFLDSNQKVQWRGHSMEMTEARLASLLGGD